MNRMTTRATPWLGIVLITLASVSVAEDFEMARWTIDDGGATFSTGGAWELSGTIGQPDAGRMDGGSFTLTGGFWFRVGPVDCNSDGLVNLHDYDNFEPCMSGPDGGLPTPRCACFDLDADDDVDLRDASQLQAVFGGM
jgi:hypothetical protein